MLVWEEDMVRALRKERESLREENARLTQRVEELERAPRCCADTIPPGCRTCRCADAAEAKLARVVSILSAVSMHDDTESICLRALAAAKGE